MIITKGGRLMFRVLTGEPNILNISVTPEFRLWVQAAIELIEADAQGLTVHQHDIAGKRVTHIIDRQIES